MGRLHSVAIGCFQGAQPQGPLFGDESAKAAGMSRPKPRNRELDMLPLAHQRAASNYTKSSRNITVWVVAARKAGHWFSIEPAQDFRTARRSSHRRAAANRC